MNKLFGLCALGMSLVGCVGSNGSQDDPRDEVVISGGKSDAFGISEGSPDANGILELVNSADEDTLRNKAGLGPNAVGHILSTRAGADGTDGTADDHEFTSLADLDAVPFVGSTAFANLLAYARANGYVTNPDDPFDPASCTGSSMSLAEIDQHMGELGLYQFKIRSRSCSSTSGSRVCGDWETKDVTTLSWATAASGTLMLGKTSGGDRRLWLEATKTCPVGSTNTWSGSSCTGLSDTLACTVYVDCANKPYEPVGASSVFDEELIKFSGNMTDHCVRLTAKTSHSYFYGAIHDVETEFAVLQRF